MARYRKKPVVIEAFKLGYDPMPDWFMHRVTSNVVFLHMNGIKDGHAIIRTLEGEMRADAGDMVILGVKQEVYPCKNDIFEATYEPA